MTKQKRKLADKNTMRDIMTNKRVGNKEVVIVDNAIDYVKKQGYIVSRPKELTATMFTFAFLTMFLFVLSMTNVHAELLYFDKVAKSDASPFVKADSSKYGLITIKNDFYEKLNEYSLTSKEEGVIDLAMNMKITVYQKGALFDDKKFYDIIGKETTLKESRYYIKGKQKYIISEPVYKNICTTNLNKNTSQEIEVCNTVITDRKNIETEKEDWVEYKLGSSVEPGNYEARLETKRNINQIVDIQPCKSNVCFTPWVWFNATASKIPIEINTIGNTYDTNTTLFLSFNLSNSSKYGSSISNYNKTILVYQDSVEIARDIVPLSNGNSSIRFKVQASLNDVNNSEYALYILSSDGTPKTQVRGVYWAGDDFNDNVMNHSYWSKVGVVNYCNVTELNNSLFINTTSTGTSRCVIGTENIFSKNITMEMNVTFANTFTWSLGIANRTAFLGSASFADGQGKPTSYITELGGGSILFSRNGSSNYTLMRKAYGSWDTYKMEFNETIGKISNSTNEFTTASFINTPIATGLYSIAFALEGSSGGTAMLIDYVKVYKNNLNFSITSTNEKFNVGLTVKNIAPLNNSFYSSENVTFICEANATETTLINNITLNVTSNYTNWTQKITGLSTQGYTAYFSNYTLRNKTNYTFYCDVQANNLNAKTENWTFTTNYSIINVLTPTIFTYDLTTQTNVILFIVILIISAIVYIYLSAPLGSIFLIICGFIAIVNMSNRLIGAIIIITGVVAIFSHKD